MPAGVVSKRGGGGEAGEESSQPRRPQSQLTNRQRAGPSILPAIGAQGNGPGVVCPGPRLPTRSHRDTSGQHLLQYLAVEPGSLVRGDRRLRRLDRRRLILALELLGQLLARRGRLAVARGPSQLVLHSAALQGPSIRSIVHLHDGTRT